MSERHNVLVAISQLASSRLDVQTAFESMSDVERRFYHTIRRVHVRGYIGEIFVHGLMKQLASTTSGRIVRDAADTYYSRGPLKLKYGGTGMNLQFIDRDSGAEIDGLMMYGNLPLIFEAKQGNQNYKQHMRERQRAYVQKWFGGEPITVRVRVNHRYDFSQGDIDYYKITYPYYSQIEALDKVLNNVLLLK